MFLTATSFRDVTDARTVGSVSASSPSVRLRIVGLVVFPSNQRLRGKRDFTGRQAILMERFLH
jgi:hypothetical protein